MKVLNNLKTIMSSCVGYDGQSGWLSTSPIDINEHYGFVYVIHNNKHDMYYVGAKCYWFKNGDTFKESDWRDYYGSSKFLDEAIREVGIEHFDRYVISEWNTQQAIFNAESNLQEKLDVLTAEKPDGTRWFYNRVVGKSFYSPDYTEERRHKLSQATIERFKKPEEREKMSKLHKGKPKSPEHIEKMRQNSTGKSSIYHQTVFAEQKEATNPNRIAGALKAWSDPEIRKRRVEAMSKPRPILKCPHCGLEGGSSNMKRYHFDNCKSK